MTQEQTSRAQWLEERRKGIGGSDAAMVLGLSRWGGPFTVWNNKVNGISTVEENEAIEMGIRLEPIVADIFSERTGLQVRPSAGTAYRKDLPFMLANVDRDIVGFNQGLECKTTSAYKAEEWEGDNLPDEYYVQVQHYCVVRGWEGCWIACLIGGQRFVCKYVPRNPSFADSMISAEKDFWENFVIPKVPPALNPFDDLSVVDQKDEAFVGPTEEDLRLALELAEISDVADRVEEHKERLELHFKNRIGDHAGMLDVATWKKTKPSPTTDWKAVAMELNPSMELIEKHTATKEGTRRFLFKFKANALKEAV